MTDRRTDKLTESQILTVCYIDRQIYKQTDREIYIQTSDIGTDIESLENILTLDKLPYRIKLIQLADRKRHTLDQIWKGNFIQEVKIKLSD